MANNRILRYYLAHKYQGDFTPENFEEVETDLQVDDIKLIIESSPHHFLVQKYSKDKWRIRLKIDVKFCLQYQNGTCTGGCRNLHLCKYFVISGKFCPGAACVFGFSHDICDVHNNKVWKFVSPELYTCTPILKLSLIRNSFPRVCPDFSKDGKCHSLFCGKLHICSKYVFGVCTECQLSKFSRLSKANVHNLSSEHNSTVLNFFNLSGLECDRNILLANILLRKYINDKFSETSSPITPSKDVNMFQNQIRPLVLCYYYLNSVCMETLCNGLHICKEYLVNKCHPDDCTYGFSHNLLDAHNFAVAKSHGLHEYPQENLLKIIQKRLPWICRNYQMKKVCSNVDCKKIHICPRFAENNCSHGNCYLSHEFNDDHNLKVLKCYLLDKTDNIATNILFSRTEYSDIQNIPQQPAVNMLRKKSCDDNIGNRNIEQNLQKIEEDSLREKRIVIFMIDSFPNVNCHLTNLLMFFDGDKATAETWFSNHLSTFRLVRNRENEITVHVCLSKVTPCQFYWGKDGCSYKNCAMFHICKKILLNIPHSSISCKYKHKIEIPMSVRAEKKLGFLNDDQLLTILRFRYPFICEKYLDNDCQLTDVFCPNLHVCYDFMRRKCKKQVCDYNHENALNGDQALRLIKEYHLFIKTFRYCIMLPKRNEHCIDSKEITSEFNSLKQDLTKKCINVSSHIPSHWPVNCKKERIMVAGPLYSKIEIDFKDSIRRAVTVTSIEEICNAEYYEKYAAKKKSISETLPHVIEKSLYHGITSEAVAGVCAQNFDSRCGNNGTVYGLGRYFAVNAKYSHSYTKADSSDVRYMFLADVLVGRYTLGSSLLNSPPPSSLKNPHKFYDSVVDNTVNPTLFVIFEPDQCYPRYLISYKSN